MQATDQFKLAYQHVFGGGHLVTDEQESLDRLTEEMKAVSTSKAFDPMRSDTFSDADRFESIGNDLYRLHFEWHRIHGIEIATINRFFIRQR
jgi:hypothetical protein